MHWRSHIAWIRSSRCRERVATRGRDDRPSVFGTSARQDLEFLGAHWPISTLLGSSVFGEKEACSRAFWPNPQPSRLGHPRPLIAVFLTSISTLARRIRVYGAEACFMSVFARRRSPICKTPLDNGCFSVALVEFALKMCEEDWGNDFPLSS